MSDRARASYAIWILVAVLFAFVLVVLGHEVEVCPRGDACGTLFEKFGELPLNAMGDTLAGVFSPLAFFAAVCALLLQSRELAESRRETAKSAKALKSQSAILEKREKGEEFEELLIAICNESALEDVSWIFENQSFPEDTFGRYMEVRLHFDPLKFDTNDDLIIALGYHIAEVSGDLEIRFDRYHLPENPRVWSGYNPVRLFFYCDKISRLFPELSPAKQQRFKNLKIQKLRDALSDLTGNEEWWRP